MSVSRKQTWESCQLKYKYKYHLELHIPSDTPSFFTYGKMVHKIAELYVIGKGLTDISELARDCFNGKIKVENNTEIKVERWFYYKIQRHIENIRKISNTIGFDGMTEYKFGFQYENAFISGVIDRLIARGNKYYILDYKTTKKGPFRKDAVSIKEDEQLRCYAFAVSHLFNVQIEDVKVALYYLDEPELISTKYTKDQIDSTLRELDMCYVAISSTNEDNVNANPGTHCKFCEYKSICPSSGIMELKKT